MTTDTTFTRAAIKAQPPLSVPEQLAPLAQQLVTGFNTTQLLLCDILDELRRLNQLTYRRNPDDDIPRGYNT